MEKTPTFLGFQKCDKRANKELGYEGTIASEVRRLPQPLATEQKTYPLSGAFLQSYSKRGRLSHTHVFFVGPASPLPT